MFHTNTQIEIEIEREPARESERAATSAMVLLKMFV